MQSQESCLRRDIVFPQKCSSCGFMTADLRKDCQCFTCQSCLFLNDSEMQSKLQKARPCRICHNPYQKFSLFEKSIRSEQRFGDESHHQNPFKHMELESPGELEEYIENEQVDFLDQGETDISHVHEPAPSLNTTGHHLFVNEEFEAASPVHFMGRREMNRERTEEVSALLQELTPTNLFGHLEECY